MAIIRKTKPLRQVLQAFEESTQALSAIELFEKLKDEMNKSTVYRTLDRLEDEGIIHSFLGGDGLKWYAKCDNCNSHEHEDVHPHFQCNECGKVDCLSIHIDIPKIANRKIESTHFLIFGICEECL